jgi:hypothetical protein
MKRHSIALVVSLLACGHVLAASPPSRLNYQGVLRDPAGVPLSGPHDMVFRLYDAPAGGNQVLVDEHLASGTGAVVVTGGLFSTAIGSGNVLDGLGPGTFSSLGDVFRRLTAVYLEVQVGGEILNPRIHVKSAAYALDDADVDPPCFSAGNRFTDCGNGTVTDSITGVVWLKMVDCAALFGASKTWVLANQTVALLADGQCGLTDKSRPGDWRLPTSAEMGALVTRANTNGCASPRLPDQTGLGCCGTGTCTFSSISTNIGYWTSTTVEATPANAVMVDLFGGTTPSVFKGVGEHAWAVRDPR